MYQSIHDIVRKAESNYLNGNTKLGKYVNWSMHDTIERIDAYLNAKHISGDIDSLGREKPFFDIVTSITNIWYRATDIDRKDIKFTPTNNESVVLAFVANIILQNWMNENRFGQFLNAWGRSLARYGSSIPKFVEKDGKLVPSIVPWNRYIADPVQFDALPRIEKLYLTPAQLRKMSNYDQDAVDALIEKHTIRKTLDKEQKDTMSEFIEVYEVHGELDSRCLEDEPDLSLPNKDIKYVQQMQAISYIQENGKDGYNDFTLYKGREKQDPYMITHLIEEDGRTLAIGAVEHAFEAQWQRNHSIKNMKDTLDLASRLIFQTADTNFVGRNVLTAIETGDVMIHADGKPLERIANDNPSIQALQNYGQMWSNVAQDITATPDAMRGSNMPSNVAYQTKALAVQQANSLFELMTENKGLHLEDMLKTFVIPYIKRQLKHKKQVVAILDQAGITQIDSMYVPNEAIKQFNKKTIAQTFAHIQDPENNPPPQPYNAVSAQQDVMQQQASQGNTRFFIPSDADDSTWAKVFSDFEWDSVRVEITAENSDKQTTLTTLNSVFSTIASNPMILNNPDAKVVFTAILNETGKISPMQLTNTASLPPPRPVYQIRETIDFKNLPPDAQEQTLEKLGIQTQPQGAQTVGGQPEGVPANK